MKLIVGIIIGVIIVLNWSTIKDYIDNKTSGSTQVPVLLDSKNSSQSQSPANLDSDKKPKHEEKGDQKTDAFKDFK